MKLIEKHIRRDDLVDRKIRILAETQQLESGLSSNIFRCGHMKARKKITKTWLTALSEELFPFGITIAIQMSLPESPTIMDIAITTHFTTAQLQSINRARLHNKKIHVGVDSYQAADWSVRQCQREDQEILKSFLLHLTPSPLKVRLPVFQSFQQPLTKAVSLTIQRGPILSIAYDGSYDDHTMAASISVFEGMI